jgi:hypothetical protein
MAKTKRTYIVNVTDKGKIESFTLRDWCAKIGLNYNTALARIWRTNPTVHDGIIHFDANDPIVRHGYGHGGRPADGVTPEKRKEKNQITAKRHRAPKGLQPSVLKKVV